MIIKFLLHNNINKMHRYLFVCAVVLKCAFSVAVTAPLNQPGAAEDLLTMDIEKVFKDNEIVSDVIDTAPKHWVQVTYKSGAVVQAGNELTPTNVSVMPTVTWDADEDSYYTLIMTDPDAPSRAEPKFREVRHWLVVNIPGNNVAEGKTLFEFIGSGPPQGTGLHRYVFLIYKQKGLLETDEEVTTNKSRKGRLSSSTRTFLTKYNLGNSIAGNFYIAQYDDYVPILHAQLAQDTSVQIKL